MQLATTNKTGDQLLWTKFKNDDRQAFAFLYYRYFTVLQQTACGFCNDKELVKDCIHDLFMTIWKNRKTLSEPRSVKAYLLRSVQRKVVRQLKRSRYAFVEFTEKNVEHDIVHSVEKKIIADQLCQQRKFCVVKALETLTKRQKEAVYLKFYADLSYAEIAGKMDISVDAIYNLVSKAMNNMQGRLSRNLLHA